MLVCIFNKEVIGAFVRYCETSRRLVDSSSCDRASAVPVSTCPQWQDLQLSGARIRFYLISVTQQQQEAKEITETMNGSG